MVEDMVRTQTSNRDQRLFLHLAIIVPVVARQSSTLGPRTGKLALYWPRSRKCPNMRAVQLV